MCDAMETGAVFVTNTVGVALMNARVLVGEQKGCTHRTDSLATMCYQALQQEGSFWCMERDSYGTAKGVEGACLHLLDPL